MGVVQCMGETRDAFRSVPGTLTASFQGSGLAGRNTDPNRLDGREGAGNRTFPASGVMVTIGEFANSTGCPVSGDDWRSERVHRAPICLAG